MTATANNTQHKLIHAARYFTLEGTWRYLFLRKVTDTRFAWFDENPSGNESLTEIEAITPEEAIRVAARHWKPRSFQTIICGFRYTLPERDEHGINAYFHQMAASYATMNGVYYDEELGNNCFVQFASDTALQLLRRLKQSNRLG